MVDHWEERISMIKFRNYHNNRLKITLPFKQGWLISLNAIKSLIDELFEAEESVNFVLTRRLNHDPVEVRYLPAYILYSF